MDDIEDEHQFELCKSYAGNHMLQAAHALAEALIYAPEGTEVGPFMNVAEFLIQEAEFLLPDGEQWPELPDNVIPISKFTRRK